MRWDIVYNNLDYLLWGSYPNGPLGGICASIMLAVLGIFGAFWLGLVFGLMRLSKSRILRGLAMVYVEVIRGTPLLMLIFWFYFLGPVIFDYNLPEFQSALLAFVVLGPMWRRSSAPGSTPCRAGRWRPRAEPG